MIKDSRLLDAISYLEETLYQGSFEIADYWEADLLSLGIINPLNPGILAYLSVRGPPLYTVIIEIKDGEGIPRDRATFNCGSLADMTWVIRDMLAIEG